MCTDYENSPKLAAALEYIGALRLRLSPYGLSDEALDAFRARFLEAMGREPEERHPCGDWPAPCNCDDPVLHNGH